MNKKIIFILGGIIVSILAVYIIIILSNNYQGIPDENFGNIILPTLKTAEDQQSGKRYLPYTKALFESSKDKKRIYFFHAAWCPTCKAANEAFTNRANEIPEDVIIFKTDYDTQTELKKKYGITYQHTFVQVDENGEAITKWNGGDIDSLKMNLK